MKKILVVQANYYAKIAEELSAGASEAIKNAGFEIEYLNVPGAFEIPGAISFASKCNEYAGFVALGCVVRGETSHYDYVCGESARGLMQLVLEKDLAIGNAILTVENQDQAMVRAKVDKKNKGGEAALACIEMIKIKDKYS